MLEFWRNLAVRVDPVAFNLWGLEVRYYGLMYLVAFLVSYGLIRSRMRKDEEWKGFSVKVLEDLMLVGVLGVVVGGRLGYILFYDLGYYLKNPLEVIWPFNSATGEWAGISGMSFHGGLLAVVLGVWLYCRLSKVKFSRVVSLVVPTVPLGYMFGRIGNFLNDELWGKSTDFILGMQKSADSPLLYHPSQLYEAFFEGLVLFIVLWSLRNNPWFKNHLLALFLIGYAGFRFLIEFVRVPDAHLGYLWLNLSMGQILSIAMIMAGVALIVWRNRLKA